MLSLILPPFLLGVVSSVLTVSSMVITFAFLMPAIVLKLIPYPPLNRACSRYSVRTASVWASFITGMLHVLHKVDWDVDIRGELRKDRNYLLICNHQSWADIVVVLALFHRRTPFPRFFLKHELLWVPIIGLGCWAMDFPFMRRHSHEAVARNPALRLQDQQTTRKACERFRSEPVTVINFAEGTRFTETKRRKRNSPYDNLLSPRAGGLSCALDAMGEQFEGIIDVTIAYRPGPKKIFWSFLCGRQSRLRAYAEVIPVPRELIHGDYDHDAEFRQRMQNWLNALWARKDERLQALNESFR